jgi:group I intron endonuclease
MEVMDMLIYKITNTVTGKVYIGQTIQPLRKRWHGHKGARRTCPLTSSIKKHGISNFTIEPLCSVLDKSYLDDLEIYFIKLYDCVIPNGYNVSSGGSIGRSRAGLEPWNKGIEATDEIKHKLSIAHKGQKAWNKGISPSKKTRLKISQSKKGQRCSPTTEFKPGAPSAFKGRKHTAESLALVSKNGNRKEIQCIETGEIFPSMKAASEKTGIAKSYLFRLCYSGKRNIKLGLSFKFV